MTNYCELLEIYKNRGFIHQATDLEGLNHQLSNQRGVCYIGYDATADSLHVGSLVSIMMLRWFQKCGHQPIVLMGAGTTRVGDPSGKDESRKLLTEEMIASHVAHIEKIFAQFLSFDHGENPALLVNNAQWLCDLNYIDFLRDYGRHFSVNRMLSFESVKQRLSRQQPLSFLEFNYMILQAYDFLQLHQHHQCILQMGGSDQWGNIINGVELTRRITGKEVFGLTTPLITTSDGKKMGKTAQGAIWLNEERLPSYEYYQFWRNTKDEDVISFLKLFTEMDLIEIQRLSALKGSEINEAKKQLAFHATALCRGHDAAKEAEKTAQETFEKGQQSHTLPTYSINREDLEKGIPAFDLWRRTPLCQSGAQARRLIKQGGARLNNQLIHDENMIISTEHLNEHDHLKLSSGKKNHCLLKPV